MVALVVVTPKQMLNKADAVAAAGANAVVDKIVFTSEVYSTSPEQASLGLHIVKLAQIEAK